MISWWLFDSYWIREIKVPWWKVMTCRNSLQLLVEPFVSRVCRVRMISFFSVQKNNLVWEYICAKLIRSSTRDFFLPGFVLYLKVRFVMVDSGAYGKVEPPCSSPFPKCIFYILILMDVKHLFIIYTVLQFPIENKQILMNMVQRQQLAFHFLAKVVISSWHAVNKRTNSRWCCCQLCGYSSVYKWEHAT